MGNAVFSTSETGIGARSFWRRDSLTVSAHLRRDSGRAWFWSPEGIAVGLICAAVLYNFVLAFINAHVGSLNREIVILCEIFIVNIALAICLLRYNHLMIPWAGLVCILSIIFIVSSIAHQSYNIKYLRDVLLIPIFIALGMTFVRGNIVRLFCALQTLILAVMLIEALAPEGYVQLLKPWSYYAQTRPFLAAQDSWHQSGLYISSLRPDGRLMFEMLGIHRLSSIFLEPVSLGNWCVVVTIFITMFWRLMPAKMVVYLIVSNAILLIGCDGRLALVCSVLIVILSTFAHLLPRYVYIAYLPLAVLMVIVLAALTGADPNTDDFLGRIAKTAFFLMKLDFAAVHGFDHSLIERTADSGIVYLILTQSLAGVALLWVAICLLQPPNSRHAVLLMHGTCIYVSLLLLISSSLFSIKTAAPLWFLYGYVRAKGFLECPIMAPATLSPMANPSHSRRPL